MKRETVSEIDLGRMVLCDICNDDYTDSPRCGGFMFGTYAACPECAPGMYADALKCGEKHLIGEGCPDGVTFADWIRELRGDNNSIVIQKLVPLKDKERGDGEPSNSTGK